MVLDTEKFTSFQGFTGYPAGYMNPADQRGRTPGGQYYAEYATINNQGGRSGPNRPPDIPQVNPAMQDYADYQGTAHLASLLLEPEYRAFMERLGRMHEETKTLNVQLRKCEVVCYTWCWTNHNVNCTTYEENIDCRSDEKLYLLISELA